MTNTLCGAACGNTVYVQRNAAFTLHLGHVTGDMKRCESNVGDGGQGGQGGWAFATYVFGGVKC